MPLPLLSLSFFSHFSPSDPDIQHLPFFAISPAFFSSLWSSYYKRILHFDRFANFFTAIQHKLFYVVMAFARFNLYALSYRFLLKKAFDKKRARGGRWAYLLEIAGILFFWSWFGSLLYGCGSWSKALVYLLVSHAVTSPLHIQVTTYRIPSSIFHPLTFHLFQLDCSLPFLHVNRRSRSRRILRTPAIAHNHRRYLSRQFGLSSWRSSSPGHPSPLSPPSSPQFAQS